LPAEHAVVGALLRSELLPQPQPLTHAVLVPMRGQATEARCQELLAHGAAALISRWQEILLAQQTLSELRL
jgi:hypothetical protein